MTGICFYFEDNDKDVWSGRRIDLDAWLYAIRAAGDINEMIVINRTEENVTTPSADITFDLVAELPELPGKVTHVVCPWNAGHGSIELWDFNHKTDWYVFGPSEGWRKAMDNSLYIPMANSVALHSTHIASTVLLHRYRTLCR